MSRRRVGPCRTRRERREKIRELYQNKLDWEHGEFPGTLSCDHAPTSAEEREWLNEA